MDVNIALLAGDGIGPEIIAEPTRQAEISYAVFCLKKKKNRNPETSGQHIRRVRLHKKIKKR